jgi:hypothetical protein
VRSPSAATFKWRISVGSAAEEASEIILKDSSGNVLARQTIDLTKTTGWNDWYETETNVELPAGVQKLTMEFTGTSTYLVNVNWIEFENTTLFGSALKMDAQQQNRPCQIFDMNGKYLGQLNVQNWNQVVDLMKGNNYSRGVYLVMDKAMQSGSYKMSLQKVKENKMNKIKLSILFTAVAILPAFSQINDLVKTPPMGWNSWNVFHENINENQIKEIADVMVSSGMKDAGYIYLNLDDNWMAKTRNANGDLQADPTRFPSGMKALGDYIHNKGLKFGIYGDRGVRTCHHYNNSNQFPNSGSGSYMKEERDARLLLLGV